NHHQKPPLILILNQCVGVINIHPAIARRLERDGSRICTGAGGRASEIDLRDFREIVVIALGKASIAMAEGFQAVLAPDFKVEGILVSPAAPPRALQGWRSFVGGHPLPTEESFVAGRAILERLARCDERSLAVFLISGGGSSMGEAPLDAAIGLDDFSGLT